MPLPVRLPLGDLAGESAPSCGKLASMDRAGRSELHYRALDGDVDGIRDRLAAGDDVQATDANGFTALHFAAQMSRAEAVAALLAAGAPVDPQDKFGNTPLWRAVFNSKGDPAVVRLLVAAGADPDCVNHSGSSPRGITERVGNFDMSGFFD